MSQRRPSGRRFFAHLPRAIAARHRLQRQSDPYRPSERTPRLDIFLQQMVNGLTLGSVYAVVALGYTMVYGIVQLINFAHGEVVMIGAMVAYSVISALTAAHVHLPPVAIVALATLAAIPTCMLLGYLLERAAAAGTRRARAGSRAACRSGWRRVSRGRRWRPAAGAHAPQSAPK